MTDERREQNREHQRKYREKQKRRIAELERAICQKRIDEPPHVLLSALSPVECRADISDKNLRTPATLSLGKTYPIPSTHLGANNNNLDELWQVESPLPNGLHDCSSHTCGRAATIASPGERAKGQWPSPWESQIRLQEVCVIAACLENALSLNIPAHEAIVPDRMSPFYCPGGLIKLNDFSNLPESLRPCATQIMTKHRLYIDLIPIPFFRERMISLIATIPSLEEPLANDIDNNGMICSGSAAGRGSGRAWDPKSWEVQLWFRRKWWFLFGNQELRES